MLATSINTCRKGSVSMKVCSFRALASKGSRDEALVEEKAVFREQKFFLTKLSLQRFVVTFFVRTARLWDAVCSGNAAVGLHCVPRSNIVSPTCSGFVPVHYVPDTFCPPPRVLHNVPTLLQFVPRPYKYIPVTLCPRNNMSP